MTWAGGAGQAAETSCSPTARCRFLGAKEIRPAGDGNPNPNLTKNGISGIDWPP